MDTLPDDIITDLIAAYLNGEASVEQSQALQEWIRSSPGNKAYYEELKKAWDESGRLDPAPAAVDTDKAWLTVSSRIDTQKPERKISIPAFYRIAAMLLPPVLILGIILVNRMNPLQEVAALHEQVHSTLSDSSAIILNAGSTITFPKKFKGSTREVSLRGEGFFRVAHDSTKPFIVHTGEASIKVLGTSFNVNANDDSANVVVYVNSGKVKLYGKDDGEFVVLKAGCKGIYNKETHTASIVSEPRGDEIFWMDRTLVFNKTELAMVAEVLHKFYNITVIMDNESLQKCRLTAVFKNQPIDTIIEIIAKSFNLKVTKTDSTYTLEGDGC